MPPITHRIKAPLLKFRAAKRYFNDHGFRATLTRLFDALFRDPLHGSTVAANRWLNHNASTLTAAINTSSLAKPSVAIIGSLDLPQCKKYRVNQKIEQLELHGIDATVSSFEDVPRSFDALQLATSVIFYRVTDGKLFQAYLAEARRLGLTVCYDIDDPIFSFNIYRDNQNLSTLSRSERRHLLANTLNYKKALQQCDLCIVSTPGMHAATSALTDKPVYLWRNALDRESLSIYDSTTAEQQESNNALDTSDIRIGYMSGSRAHDLDFALIAPALAEVLKHYNNTRLILAGHADLPSILQPFESRVEHKPFSSYHSYYRTVSDLDIILVPLLPGTFNACKSAIRFLEGALFSKPCITSAVGDFLNIVEHGTSGFLADSHDDWYHHMAELINSVDLRDKIGHSARAKVLNSQTSSHIGQSLDIQLIQLLKGIASNA